MGQLAAVNIGESDRLGHPSVKRADSSSGLHFSTLTRARIRTSRGTVVCQRLTPLRAQFQLFFVCLFVFVCFLNSSAPQGCY